MTTCPSPANQLRMASPHRGFSPSGPPDRGEALKQQIDLAGYDGNVLVRVSTRITSHRVDHRIMRCRPGSFDWRYAKRQSALYHAGNQFRLLWEKAGIALASSVDFMRGTKSGSQMGISESRLHALQSLSCVVTDLGRFSTERLIDYCVLGHTTAELANKHALPDRDMAAVLDKDLRSCADAMRYS